MKATLENGEEITVIARKGHDLYRAPGAPGNFGGVGDSSLPQCNYYFLPLKNGRSLNVFVNTNTGLLTVDIVNARHTGGVELMRRVFGEITGHAGDGHRFVLEPLALPNSKTSSI